MVEGGCRLSSKFKVQGSRLVASYELGVMSYELGGYSINIFKC